VASVFFHTKLGTTEELVATPGQPLTDVLKRHGIPVNAGQKVRHVALQADLVGVSLANS